MTNRIIELAKQAGFRVRNEAIHTMHSSSAWVVINDELQRFYELARNEVLEDAAVLCDELQSVPATEPRHCAEDIRGMKK